MMKLPSQCTTLPSRTLPKQSTSCLSSRERARPLHLLRCGGRGGWMEGWVWHIPRFPSPCAQFVASGSRFRLYLPKDTCLVNFLLAGVSCPRAGQTLRSGDSNPGEPWGDEGLTFSKELILQREVGGAGGGPSLATSSPSLTSRGSL